MSLLSYMKYIKEFGISYWAKILNRNKIPVTDVAIDKEGSLVFKHLNLTFKKSDSQLFIKCYNRYCKKFIQTGFIHFEKDKDELFILIHGLKIRMRADEDLWICREIFIDNAYNVSVPEQIVVIDIGMNIGIASLYFGRLSNVEKVYSFEPFEPTYREALNNIELNPHLKNKIKASNFGLGKGDYQLQLNYDPIQKGNMGILNLQEGHEKKGDRVSINIKDAAACLKPILDEAGDRPVFAKIDCEGAEYEIIESLQENNLLNRFRYFMIEWHQLKDQQDKISNLQKTFSENGFLVLATGSFSNDTGMMYAVKMQKT